MQQKVAIARALLTSPTLLLLDEPTTGLDPRSKLDVQSFIEELRETHDATIVLTTHDLAEAERLCGRITILNDGRVVAEDTPDGLKTLIRDRVDGPATLEDVFMTYTGRSLDDDVEAEDAEIEMKGGDSDDVQPGTARPLGQGADRAQARRPPPCCARTVSHPSPSARPSAFDLSGSELGSRRSPHSSRLGPVEGPGRLPRLEITSMTVVTHELKASYAFIERNFNLTRRYWGWEIAFLVYSVAGALSISLIGAAQGNEELLLSLMIGAIFWNYLSVVFSWIAETITVERWEGTLEYTMMAPIQRWSQLLGSVVYAMVYGLVHTSVIFIALVLFFPQLDLSGANPATVVAFMLLGSFSFVGIGMIAAILPLLYVERGAQMTFVLQSCLLLVSGVYYSVTILPPWMQVLSKLSPATYVLEGVRAGLIDGKPVSELTYLVWPLIVMGIVLIPFGLWAFGRAERYAKRTGKLKRVG